MLLHSVAHDSREMQRIVARERSRFGTLRIIMADWRQWRARLKDIKRDSNLKDADIAANIEAARIDAGIPEKKARLARGTVNSWLNKREPNLSDFFELCEAMGADPGHVLFEQPVIRGALSAESIARRVVSASPTAEPGYGAFQEKLRHKSREFKKKRTKLRRVVKV